MTSRPERRPGSWSRTRDRGPGIATSNLATYVEPGEIVVEISSLHSTNNGARYSPSSFGLPVTDELRGADRSNEARLFVAYGLSSRAAIELDAGFMRTDLTKAPDDPTPLPESLTHSSLGDLRARLDLRLRREGPRRPELFGFVETTRPRDERQELRAPGWVASAGLGLIRGFRWGTLTVRAGTTYEPGSPTRIDYQTIAFEVLKQVTPKIRVFAAALLDEGNEGAVAAELHWQLRPALTLTLARREQVRSSALALIDSAPDSTTAIGFLVRFR